MSALHSVKNRRRVVGELGGSASFDALALNNRFQLAWHVLGGEPFAFRAYVCQLGLPATPGGSSD